MPLSTTNMVECCTLYTVYTLLFAPYIYEIMQYFFTSFTTCGIIFKSFMLYCVPIVYLWSWLYHIPFYDYITIY